LFFPNFVFANSGLMQIIFNELSLVNLTQSNLPMRLKIIQKYESTDKMYQDPIYGANFTLKITNIQDFYYARNLLDIYLNLIKPFLNENKEFLERFSPDFRRFNFFRKPLIDPGYGKAFTNLDTASHSSPHGPPNVVHLDDYYMSHFRSIAQIARTEAPIDSIVFDFNYFFCYFRPIFEKLKRKFSF
jgi:hypothetical protein